MSCCPSYLALHADCPASNCLWVLPSCRAKCCGARRASVARAPFPAPSHAPHPRPHTPSHVPRGFRARIASSCRRVRVVATHYTLRHHRLPRSLPRAEMLSARITAFATLSGTLGTISGRPYSCSPSWPRWRGPARVTRRHASKKKPCRSGKYMRTVRFLELAMCR
jgi:hypothetical protein